MDWPKPTTRRDDNHLSFGILCIYIRDFTVIIIFNPLRPEQIGLLWQDDGTIDIMVKERKMCNPNLFLIESVSQGSNGNYIIIG